MTVKNVIAAGTLGLLIVGGVAVAQTSNTQNQMDTTSTTQTGTQNMGNQTTGTPYNQSNTMQGGSQDGSTSQWAGERG